MRQEAERFRETEGVPEWPLTTDYRNDYYWRMKLKTPFPPGFAGDFLRKLEDENFIRAHISNPHIYYPKGRPESEHDYIMADSLKRRMYPHLFPHDDVEMPFMIDESQKASWNTPGAITPVTEEYAIPEITQLRGWAQGGHDHIKKWPNRYDDPIMYIDWKREPVSPPSTGHSTNVNGRWRWDSPIPQSWLFEDMQRMATYAHHTREQNNENIIWSHPPDPREQMDDIDTDYYYQQMRNIDNDFDHGIPEIRFNEDPELAEITDHSQMLRQRRTLN